MTVADAAVAAVDVVLPEAVGALREGEEAVGARGLGEVQRSLL